MRKNSFAGIFAFVMLLLFSCGSVFAATPAEDIVILYTNDVHCGVDDVIGYAGLEYYKKEMQNLTPYVTLVDAGDWAQGGNVGSISQGEYILNIMNAVGYDVAVPGNHEFDYGWSRFMSLSQELNCGFISSNLRNVQTGALVFSPYKIFTYGDVKVAFVGACTPESIAKSTPSYFKDANGNYLYGFDSGNEGADLVESIQKAADDAKAEGADYVIVVGHLGTSGDVTPYWSTLFIAPRTNNIDAFIDGHTHQVIPEYIIQNKDGDDVIITQTGTKLNYVGKLTISTSGEIKTELLGSRDITGRDSAIQTVVDNIKATVEATTGEVLAYTSFDLTINDSNGNRLVRNGETGLCNLITDAFLDASQYSTSGPADIAFFNGGGIRKSIAAGNITYGNVLDVTPFGNTATIIETSGQTIADELEMGARNLPDESGGFLHSAGLTYVIDTTIPSSVVVDDNNMFLYVDGERRIRNIMVNGEPIDLEKKYKVAAISYFLLDEGDGHMFYNSTVLEPDFDLEINLITDYIKGFEFIPEKYRNAQGRIKIITETETGDDTIESYITAARAKEALGLSESTSVFEVSGSMWGASNNVSTYAAQIPAGQKGMKALDTIQADSAGVYTFGISLESLTASGLKAGDPISLQVLSAISSNVSSAATTGDYRFFNHDTGAEIRTLPSNSDVDAAVYLGSAGGYVPVVTTTNNAITLSSSGGGCNSGISLIGSWIVLSILVFKRKAR